MPRLGCAEDHGRLGKRAQGRHLLLELRREPDVVGVEEGDVAAGGVPDGQVARGAHAARGLARVGHDEDPVGVPLGVAGEHAGRSVFGAVVDDDEPPVAIVLSEDALDRLLDEALRVEAGHTPDGHRSPVMTPSARGRRRAGAGRAS